MDDLIDDPAPGRNEPEYTVSEISGAVKRTLEGEFGRIRVRGEVSKVMQARSGHLYFDIKDDRSVLSCTSWKGQVAQLSVIPEEGMEIVATGKMTSFAATMSKYQLNVDDVRVAGAGALLAMLEKRRAALAAEGLFEPSRKKPIPMLPDVIGVVTSPQGAVIRDILHRLRDRFPRHVLIWPVAVQGKACAPEVVNAIRGFDALRPGGAIPRPDLLIVARGGGSIEDLWGFNEEAVVRAVADCSIPLISAVGHETDTTLIDHVSDWRAPTPTAAAERAVPVRLDLLAHVDSLSARQSRSARAHVAQRGQRLTDLGRGLPRPDALLAAPRQRLDVQAERLPAALRARTARARVTLSRLEGRAGPSSLKARAAQARRDLETLSVRLDAALPRATRRAREALQSRVARLRPGVLTRQLGADRTRLATVLRALSSAANTAQQTRRDRLMALDRLRESLGYERTLERGFAVIRDGATVITDAKAARAAGQVTIQFAQGDSVDAVTGAASRTRKKPKPSDQGSLF
ncbi:MAG: exodeoxyribonuclease VII large subunit [Pseudomonadota bacterium]